MDDFEKKKCDAFIAAYSSILPRAFDKLRNKEDAHEKAFEIAWDAADEFVTWFIEHSGIDEKGKTSGD